MKALENLNHPEKAVLLHQLFPQEMPALIAFIKGMCDTILDDQEQLRTNRQEQAFTFDMWLGIALEIKNCTQLFDERLQHDPYFFAQKLFSGHNASFSNHCIEVYFTARQQQNQRLIYAVKMLYEI